MMPPMHADSQANVELEVRRWFPEVEIKLQDISVQDIDAESSAHDVVSRCSPNSDFVDD